MKIRDLLKVSRRTELWVLAFAILVLVPEFWTRWYEARFFPVITRLEVTGILAEPEGSVIIGRARRLRNCNWVETRWWLGRRGEQRVPVVVEFRDPPQIRSEGETGWVGMVVQGMLPDQVLRNSHSDVVYRCYGGPWSGLETIVPFYDGVGQDIGLLEADRQQQLLDAVEGLRNRVDEVAP
ncbi:MAG: hypothetical protein GKR99_12200 [Rhodobacteraceae bacterium]|nr:hypothetical protein [Paracoccaceae bacterium]